MERQNPLTSRGASAIAMAVEGHEDPFPPRWLNVRCVIRHGTFAETNGNGRDAPEAAICARRNELAWSTQSWPSSSGARGAITLLLQRYDRESSPGVSVKGIGCASYFEIVIGIPTFSIRPMVV
jgi:hypothetical protein